MEIVVGILSAAVVVMAILLGLSWRLRGAGGRAIQDAARSEFEQISRAALSSNSEQFLTLAKERLTRDTEAGTRDLDTRKQLIDQQLGSMKEELGKVSTLIREIERDREAKFGELTAQLKAVGEQTIALTDSTVTLREALSSSRARGQWGERMAEDVLRLIGFVDGVNYIKQATIESAGTRPDFVFLLPGELRMNMDVKFPLDNYLRFLEDDSDPERDRHKAAFLRDVRARIKEITTREYIDPEGGTVDYVLLFIPNESVYSFIHENDPGLLDVALSSRVICCSPMTLFAVLVVVRQAVDNFALQKESEEIISQLGRFNSEWEKFCAALATVGKRIGSAQNAYEEVLGPRKRMLERPLSRIEALRQRQGIGIAPDLEEPVALGEGSRDESDLE